VTINWTREKKDLRKLTKVEHVLDSSLGFLVGSVRSPSKSQTAAFAPPVVLWNLPCEARGAPFPMHAENERKQSDLLGARPSVPFELYYAFGPSAISPLLSLTRPSLLQTWPISSSTKARAL
jgi:hypothetical protein